MLVEEDAEPIILFFFFSSRRRHTRYWRDWSSDVCSSDLEVAIFYFSEYAELAGRGDSDQALVEAGKNRMRPIAMTTFAAILTFAPLALGIGQGSAMQQPLAVAIISGLVVQLPLVLLVMPVLFAALRGKTPRLV